MRNARVGASPHTAAADGGAERERFLWVVLALVIGGLWLPRIALSFWLDETVTAWVVRGDAGDVIRSALDMQGTSPAYFFVAWAMRKAFGLNEVAMRVPSVLAMVLAVVLVQRIGRRLFTAEVGILAAIVLAATQQVAFAAVDARPYAFAVASLAGATLALVRWVDDGNWKFGAAYAGLLAATMYFHYLVIVPAVVHPFYVALRRRDGGRLPLGAYAIAVAGTAAAAVPAILHLASVADRKDFYSVPGGVGVVPFLETLAPPVVVGGLLLGLLVARARTPLHLEPTVPSSRAAGVLVISWAVAPPTLLHLTAWITDSGLVSARYFISAVPGTALVAAWALGRISAPSARRAAAVALVVVALLSYGSARSDEDWRAAARVVNGAVQSPDEPILLHGTLIESADVHRFADSQWRNYFLAPLAAYPMRGRAIPTPLALGDAAEGYLNSVVNHDLVGRKRFLYVTRAVGSGQLAWLRGRLEPLGFTSRLLYRSGNLSVVEFVSRG